MKYRYTLVRSDRKSLSVSISSRNEITVRCPRALGDAAVERFLDGREGWIEKILRKNDAVLCANHDVTDYRAVYLEGRKVPLIVDGACRGGAIGADGVTVRRVSDLPLLYARCFTNGLRQRVKELAALLHVSYKSVGVKNYRARWGCCDAAGNLVFSCKLFMLPPDVQQYVIIHELCHTRCHSHAAAFWKLVAQYLPDYKMRIRKLREYDFLVRLY